MWHQHFYPFEAEQQVPRSSERGPLGAYGSSDDVAVVSKLIAALDDERQGVVVVGSQLVTVEDHHLGTTHLLLIHNKHAHKGSLLLVLLIRLIKTDFNFHVPTHPTVVVS